MSNNLITPFIMQDNGIVVNECAKIHCEDPTREDHTIIFRGYDFRIPLQLHGIFSYFVTRKPDIQSLEGAHEPLNNVTEIYTLTPTRWNPHTDVYALNEESIIDWEGNIKDRSFMISRLYLTRLAMNIKANIRFHQWRSNVWMKYSRFDHNKMTITTGIEQANSQQYHPYCAYICSLRELKKGSTLDPMQSILEQ